MFQTDKNYTIDFRIRQYSHLPRITALFSALTLTDVAYGEAQSSSIFWGIRNLVGPQAKNINGYFTFDQHSSQNTQKKGFVGLASMYTSLNIATVTLHKSVTKNINEYCCNTYTQ